VLAQIDRTADRHVRLQELEIKKHREPADGVDLAALADQVMADDAARPESVQR